MLHVLVRLSCSQVYGLTVSQHQNCAKCFHEACNPDRHYPWQVAHKLIYFTHCDQHIAHGKKRGFKKLGHLPEVQQSRQSSQETWLNRLILYQSCQHSHTNSQHFSYQTPLGNARDILQNHEVSTSSCTLPERWLVGITRASIMAGKATVQGHRDICAQENPDIGKFTKHIRSIPYLVHAAVMGTRDQTCHSVKQLLKVLLVPEPSLPEADSCIINTSKKPIRPRKNSVKFCVQQDFLPCLQSLVLSSRTATWTS